MHYREKDATAQVGPVSVYLHYFKHLKPSFRVMSYNSETDTRVYHYRGEGENEAKAVFLSTVTGLLDTPMPLKEER